MKLNSAQLKIITVALILIAISIFVWLGFGAEIFTKTQVIVEKKDEIFGNTYKVLEDKFILGLDYTLAIIGVILIPASLMLIYKRDKK